jgi:hypothetical protein
LAFALATIGLFLVSRGKWSDAIVDTGTEWIYADELSRGALLYRDVVYWFGPLTPYVLAAFLRLFGSSFPSLVVAGIAGSIGTLAALFYALRTVTGRREALLWTMLAVPVLVFMPNSGGSILGMGYRVWHPATFTLLALAFSCRAPRETPALQAAVAGLLCALAGLSRTEWGLIALAGVLAGFCLSRRAGWPRNSLIAVGVSIGLFFAAIGVFVALAGAQAVLGDGHLLLTGVSPETKRFLVAFSGIEAWRSGIVELLYSGAMWAGAVLLLQVAVLGPDFLRHPRVRWACLSIGIVLLSSALMGGAAGGVLFSAAPLICLASLIVGGRRRGRPHEAALAAFGFVGLVGSHRRPFHIGDSPYVAPPLLFAFVASAGLLRYLVILQRRSGPRRELRAGLGFAVVVLIVAAFTGRFLQYAGDERVPLPGTGGVLSAGRRTVDELITTSEAVRGASLPGDGLVVFPEGQVLNSLSGRSNPLRQKLYIPGYLTLENEKALIQDLGRRRPKAIVLWPRSTSEYGPSSFGVDYGVETARWIRRNYSQVDLGIPRTRIELFLLRKENGSPNRAHAIGENEIGTRPEPDSRKENIDRGAQ